MAAPNTRRGRRPATNQGPTPATAAGPFAFQEANARALAGLAAFNRAAHAAGFLPGTRKRGRQ